MDKKTFSNVLGGTVETLKDLKSSYNRAGGLDGLSDKITGGSWSSKFFGRHTPDEIEALFMVGTKTTTPALAEVDARTPKPWIFLRLLGASVGLYFAFGVLFSYFQNLNLIPAQILIGSFAVPLSVLCLFFELNIVYNVSVYRVSRFVLVGGLISFLYSLFIYTLQDSGSSIFWAGPIEETGKLLAMIVIAEGSQRLRSRDVFGFFGILFDWLVGKGVAKGEQYKWILNGLLFGAAVGVGFAAFETMGYAFTALIGKGGGYEAMQTTLVMRGLLSPLAHVVWSAMCGGALWSVRKGNEWRWKDLFHLRMLFFLGMASVLHGIWDVACSDPHAYFWFVGLGLVSWVIVLLQVRSGLRQVRLCRDELSAGIECPHCGYRYGYDPSLSGQEVQCGSCGGSFTVTKMKGNNK